MKNFKFAIVLTGVLVSSVAAAVQKMNQQELVSHEQGQLNSDMKVTNKKCGTNIPIEINWNAFGYDQSKWRRFSPSSRCTDVVWTLGQFCNDAAGRAAFAKKGLTKVVCSLGDKREVTVTGGIVNYTVKWATVNDSDYLKAALAKKL